MWIEQIGEIENIGTAVFYCKNEGEYFKFFPSFLRNKTGNSKLIEDKLKEEIRQNGDYYKNFEIAYLGSTKNNMNLDFSETNLLYKIQKEKFDNSYLISSLDAESQEIIPIETSTLSKLESSLFPTQSPTGTEGKNKYFGSMVISGKVVYNLIAPENCYEIELYNGILTEDDIISSYTYKKHILEDSESTSPAIIIHLGPKTELANNLKEMYYNNDPMVASGYTSEDAISVIEMQKLLKSIDVVRDTEEYSKLLDEIDDECFISLIVKCGSGTSNINLSYTSWLRNDNSNRNQNKYTLRNDEFNSLTTKFDPTSNSTAGYFDKKSGVILGNSEIDIKTTPILYKKLQRLENSKVLVDGEYYRKYSPHVYYGKGDCIFANGDLWVSIVDVNKDNYPPISNNWILKSKMLEGLNSRILVTTECYNNKTGQWESNSECGSTTLNGEVTVSSETESIRFKVVKNAGYDLYNRNGNYFGCIAYYDDLSGKQVSLSDSNFVYDKDTDTIVIDNWKKVLNSQSQTLILRFIHSYVTTTINGAIINESGKIVRSFKYSNWETELSDNGRYVRYLYTSEIDGNSGEVYNLIANNVHKFEFIKVDKYYIEKVVAKYTDGGKTITKEISQVTNGDMISSFEDTLNYSSVDYTVYFKVSLVNINIVDAELLEVSEYSLEVPYGSSKEISWYRSDGVDKFCGFKVKIENEGVDRSVDKFNDIYEIPNASMRFIDGITTISFSNITNDILIYGFKQD